MARNGEEAMNFLYQRGDYGGVARPDLILLDINIPIYNGIEVLKKIKSDKTLKKIPVIMLTTSSQQRDVDSAYLNHANSYVTKPIEMDDFLRAILKIEEFWLQLTTLSK